MKEDVHFVDKFFSCFLINVFFVNEKKWFFLVKEMLKNV